MDQAAYLKFRDAATASLISCWVAYCARPDAALFAQYLELQRRLLAADAHAQQTNYFFAGNLLPMLPRTYDAQPAHIALP